MKFRKKKPNKKFKKKPKEEEPKKEEKPVEKKETKDEKKEVGYSWKSFLPFTKEGKALRESVKEKKGPKKKKKFSFTPYLKRAGYESLEEKKIRKLLFRTAVGVSLLFSILVIISATQADKGAVALLTFMLGYWTFVFLLVLILVTLAFVIFLDIRAYKRAREIETVLPDYLQLTSANISAGMPLDRALWYAVRPNFGILSREIEKVAKETYAGKNLKDALHDFSDGFDSKVLKRSISLIIEGMSSGGEMADLLNKISLNIEETNILKKEMSADVTTYVIFIGFATLLGAPFLFGLSTQLIMVIKAIAGNVGASSGGSTSGLFSFSVTPSAVNLSDFKIYCVSMLVMSSIFSGGIISIIRKGNIKEGAILIPSFIFATVFLYYISNLALGALMSLFI